MLKPSEKEQKIIRKAFQKADPTSYVSLGRGDMEHMGFSKCTRSISIFKNDSDETFYEIHDPIAIQQFVSLVCKGIINVCDVVKKEDKILSCLSNRLTMSFPKK